MIDLPLFPDYDPSLEYSKSRIDEARDFIKKIITENNCEFTVGYSGGKDSTVLLQLIYEACKEIGIDNLKRFTITSSETRYELDFQREHTKLNIKRMRQFGLKVEELYCWPEYSYGVVTLGVGVWSLITKVRYCNKMKAYQIKDYYEKNPGGITFAGIRAEESTNRSKQERFGKFDAYGITAKPLFYCLTNDIWGYLNNIGNTFWGETYKELKAHYDKQGSSRDGCWVCPFHKGTDHYRPIQKECIERLDHLRGYWHKHEASVDGVLLNRAGMDYPGRTLPMPTAIDGDFPYAYWTSTRIARCVLRPINVCEAALDRVLEMERRYNDTLLFDFERPLIKDIHNLRRIYHVHNGKKWMLNEDYWCGRKLLDLHPSTREIYKKYKPSPTVLNRCNGDWFGRWAREWQRRDLLEPLKPVFENGVDNTKSFKAKFSKLYYQLKDCGYLKDPSKEPVKGMFDNDPTKNIKQEDLELEIIARNNK